MKPSEALTKTRELLSDQARWTQGALFRDGGVPGEDPLSADQWCLLGALDRVNDYPMSRNAHCKGLAHLIRIVGTVPPFNDHPDTTHADVLSALDKAIALAVSEGQ